MPTFQHPELKKLFDLGHALPSDDSEATAPLHPAATPLAPLGDRPPPRIPGYQVGRRLGVGGMGVVYLSVDESVNRTVALKCIRAGVLAGDEELTRFHREATALARIDHPHVVRLFDYAVADGQPYFTMEYCPGGSLKKRIDGSPWNPQDVTRLMERLADALATMHVAGVLHRDLKPGNILFPEGEFVASRCHPKIADFGLARIDSAGSSDASATVGVIGTPMYMAPELNGRVAADAKADAYSLGVIFYELLTGRVPFRGASVFETLQLARENEPVSPRVFVPGVPRDLETLCLRCLEKDPRKRLSVVELRDDLRRYQSNEPIRARPAGWPERSAKWVRRHWVASTILGVLTVAFLATIAAGAYALQLQKERIESTFVAAGYELRLQEQRSQSDRQKLLTTHMSEAKAARQRGSWASVVRNSQDALAAGAERTPALLLDLAEGHMAMSDHANARVISDELDRMADLGEFAGRSDLLRAELLWITDEEKLGDAMLARALQRGLPRPYELYARALGSETFPEAIRLLQRAVDEDPSIPGTYTLLPVLQTLSGRLDEARLNCKIAIDRFPDAHCFHVNLLFIDLFEGDRPAAEKRVELLKKMPSVAGVDFSIILDIADVLAPAIDDIKRGSLHGSATSKPLSPISLMFRFPKLASWFGKTGQGEARIPFSVTVAPVIRRYLGETKKMIGQTLTGGLTSASMTPTLRRAYEHNPEGLTGILLMTSLVHVAVPGDVTKIDHARIAELRELGLEILDRPSAVPTRQYCLTILVCIESFMIHIKHAAVDDAFKKQAVGRVQQWAKAATLDPITAGCAASTALAAGDFDLAKFVLRFGGEPDPKHDGAAGLRANIAFNTGAYGDCIKYCDVMLRQKTNEEFFLSLRKQAIERLAEQVRDLAPVAGADSSSKAP